MFKKLFSINKKDAHEFKPILSEIEDAPINPLGPLVFWIVISFMLISSLWMYFGKVDVVITATGLVIPDGEEKVIQSLDKGVVTKVFVKEGETVVEGQELAIVSPAEYEPALELNNLKEEEQRLVEMISANRVKLNLALEKKNRIEAVKDIVTQAQYDEAVQELAVLSHEAKSLQASLNGIQNKRLQLEKKEQIIKSPISGYVGQVFVHTIGGVVTPAEKLMTVVPKDAKLKIKAKVQNKDIGFIQEGMPVSIKIDTYNFQKYGLLNGEVSLVFPNSTKDEQLGYIYEVFIKPEEKTLMVEGQEQSLKIGMTTTNEIKIGKRRIIEFFIYPLIKYLDESIKVQ